MNSNCKDGYHDVFKARERMVRIDGKNLKEELHACKYCNANIITRNLPDGTMMNEVEYMTLCKKDFLQEDHPDYHRFYKKDNWKQDLQDKALAEQKITDDKSWNKEFLSKV